MGLRDSAFDQFRHTQSAAVGGRQQVRCLVFVVTSSNRVILPPTCFGQDHNPGHSPHHHYWHLSGLYVVATNMVRWCLDRLRQLLARLESCGMYFPSMMGPFETDDG